QLKIKEQVIIKPELKTDLNVETSDKHYLSKTEEAKLDDYGVKSEYSTTVSDYKQKSQYDIDMVIFEDSTRGDELWTSGSRVSSPESRISM
ncbi:MAG: hypothetical protein JSW41_02685, partial [Candidatus Aenigmatarchaeota archaeon]